MKCFAINKNLTFRFMLKIFQSIKQAKKDFFSLLIENSL